MQAVAIALGEHSQQIFASWHLETFRSGSLDRQTLAMQIPTVSMLAPSLVDKFGEEAER